MSNQLPGRPLSGTTIIDLTTFLTGPYATQVLADLGARVIKVEPPTGEASRHIAPHFLHGDSAYFHSVNRNKESVVLDLKSCEGRDVLDRMVGRADVLIENYRPGVRDRLGLDYERLSKVNPRLVMCSITGFGRGIEGVVDRPAYDIIIQALSGGMGMTGEPGQRPVRAGIPIADLAGGMFAVIGILAALHESRSSGRGQEVDISLLDCQISLLTYQAAYYLLAGQVPGPQGRGHMSFPTYQTFRAGDGREVVIAANTEAMWRSLCSALELPKLVDDERFETNAMRLQNRGILEELLNERFSQRPAEDWVERLMDAGVPVAPVNNVPEALEEPSVQERNMVVEVEHPQGGTLRLLGNPCKFSRTPAEEFVAPPSLGQDTVRVLTELADVDGEQIATLSEKGVIRLDGS